MSGRADTVYRIDPMTSETPLRNKCECCIIPTVPWKGVVSLDELSNCCVEEQSQVIVCWTVSDYIFFVQSLYKFSRECDVDP